VRDYWQQHGRGDHLLFSFHGVPRYTLDKGDPYHCHCQKTGRLVAEALELSEDQWTLSFQSRVGRDEWLRPYTDETVVELAGKGVGRLDVACPGFSADCLETLEEIAMQNAEFFEDAGGEALHYIPALNARADHIDFLTTLIGQHTLGWPVTAK
jgi:ferrochelatase